MIFYFCFHFIGPSIFYWFFGYKSTYRANFFDYNSLKIGFLLNLFTILIGIFLVWITPVGNCSKVKWMPRGSIIFLIISLVFTLGVMLTNQDYQDALKTFNTRKDYWVLGEMFFNLDFYLLFGLTYSFNFITEVSLAYVFLKVVAGSRSAPLVLLHLGLVSVVSPLAKKYYKKYSIYLLISFLFAVFGFNWATALRSKEPQVEESITERVQLATGVSGGQIYQIVGRISFLENTMLPIFHKKSNDSRSMSIFKTKYSPLNQFKIFINNVVPGDIFEFDVYPNQYYRAAFMDLTVQQAREYYTSLNLTLPVYFYMYHSFLLSIFFAGFCIWVYFIFAMIFFKFHSLLGAAIASIFYPGLLTYFDFVMIGKALIVSALSVGLFLVLAEIEARCALRFRGVSKDSVSDTTNG